MPLTSGLYIVSNRKNGKVYVGSSNNILKRWSAHKSYAKNGSVKLPKFYNALRKYGADDFEMKPLLHCSSEHLYLYEQRWLDRFFNENNYNTSKNAEAPMRGHTFSPEHIQRLKVSRQKRKTADETRKKMSLSRMGKVPSPETVKKIRNVKRIRSKYSLELIRTIRQEYADKSPFWGKLSRLAAKYSMPKNTVFNIVTNLIWKE